MDAVNHLGGLLLIFLLVLVLLRRICVRKNSSRSYLPARNSAGPAGRCGFPAQKPAWVKEDAVLDLQRELNCSHRKLADTFNRVYFAETGVSVGRTWVREFLKNQAHELLQLQKMSSIAFRRHWRAMQCGELIRPSSGMLQVFSISCSASLTTVLAGT